MRLCNHPGCEEAATAWWKGAWCGFHIDDQYGRVPMWVGQMEARPVPVGNGGAQGRRATPGTEAPPSTGVAPAPISVTELEELLARDYVGGPGFVEAV